MESIFTYSLKKIIKASFKDRDKSDQVALVEEAISGCKEAFSTLVDMNKEYLYKTAFLYMKNQEEALEVYQETVYKAYINLHKLKKPEFFKTWLTRILINNANDRLKVRDKYSAVDVIQENIIDENYGQVSLEEKIDLYSAIDSLSSQYKTAIILKYFQNLSLKEIALVMECPENTVKSYLHRAKAQLQTKLEGGES
ncbi:sigma-70 family RNA polymerase sigma factor [Clostridium tunisiense]|uniref:sigma-70 family RNA polymerase sigma factor n=1 Tax=Clostridium tunisiense TaxID=219748 RepID=UPI00037FB7F3|nr:sigma-70 family RNA polymerase sigma factor [Clostridium tunisiense]